MGMLGGKKDVRKEGADQFPAIDNPLKVIGNEL